MCGHEMIIADISMQRVLIVDMDKFKEIYFILFRKNYILQSLP